MDRYSSDGNAMHGYEPRSRRSSKHRSYAISNSSSISEDYEYRGASVTSHGRRSRDVVRCQTPPPMVKRVFERAPTPEPDVIERVIVRPAPQTIVERVIERPCTPPPKIIEREMTESPQPTIVRTRVVKVDSRADCNGSRGYIHPSSRMSKYDDYWESGGSKYRSHSSYRSRPVSRYNRSVSRSSSRHSMHQNPRIQLSRSQSFDVIHIPSRDRVTPNVPSRPSYGGHYYQEKYNHMIQPQQPPMYQPPPPQQQQLYGHGNYINSHYHPQQHQYSQHFNYQQYNHQRGYNPHVINLPPVHLTPGDMQYLGMPYPMY